MSRHGHSVTRKTIRVDTLASSAGRHFRISALPIPAAVVLRLPVTVLAAVTVVVAGIAGAESQPPSSIQDALRSALDDQLEIKVGLSLTQADQFTTWNTQQSELTIPGRSVNVEVTGSNIRIHAVFTPYLDDAGDLELVAQGQVWLDDGPEAPTRYVATYRSVPLSLGEKLLFFPLGIAGDVDEVTLKLEVEIVRYHPAAGTRVAGR